MKRGGITKASREAMELYRMRAIDLRDKGWKVNKIAEAFGVHEGSVSRWFGQFRTGGKKHLEEKKLMGLRKLSTIKKKE